MKKWFFTFLLLLTNSRLYAQCLSARKIIVITEGAKANHFAGDFEKNSKADRFLQSKGFISVKWKEDDPDIAGDAAVAYAYKYYSKSTNSYLVFHPDSHGRMIEEVVYRFYSPVCFAVLRKQFKLMTGKEIGGKCSDYINSQ